MGIFTTKKNKKEFKRPFAYKFMDPKAEPKYKYLYSVEELLESSLEQDI